MGQRGRARWAQDEPKLGPKRASKGCKTSAKGSPNRMQCDAPYLLHGCTLRDLVEWCKAGLLSKKEFTQPTSTYDASHIYIYVMCHVSYYLLYYIYIYIYVYMYVYVCVYVYIYIYHIITYHIISVYIISSVRARELARSSETLRFFVVGRWRASTGPSRWCREANLPFSGASIRDLLKVL